MSKIRLGIAVFVAMLSVAAMTSTAALAATPGWMVGGTNLKAGESVALMTKGIVQNEELEAPEGAGEKIRIKCEGIEGTNPVITGTNGGGAASVIFTGCELTEGKPPCKLASNVISTVPVLITELTLDGALAVKGSFAPETGKTFATIKFESTGGECAFKGIQPVTGKPEFLAPLGQDEMTWQPVLLFNTAGNLKLGSSGAKIHGVGELATVNLIPWSFL